MHGYVTGIAPSNHMAELFNITHLYEAQDQDIIIHHIVILKGETIRFHFSIKISAPATQIIKIIGFKHWTNFQSTPIIREYAGREYALYNLTNQCMKSIPQPQQKFVYDECTESGYLDPELSLWRNAPTSTGITKPYPTSYFVQSPTHNYIYCYKDNIMIYNITLECPFNVFKIPVENFQCELTQSQIQRQ